VCSTRGLLIASSNHLLILEHRPIFSFFDPSLFLLLLLFFFEMVAVDGGCLSVDGSDDGQLHQRVEKEKNIWFSLVTQFATSVPFQVPLPSQKPTQVLPLIFCYE
jgi:hypothetical protein